MQAAEEIADGARDNAAWSVSIPPNIRTEQVSDTQVNVVCDAPPAYPAETRSRHPLFGDRQHWYAPPGPPFLGPAADERAGARWRSYATRSTDGAGRQGSSEDRVRGPHVGIRYRRHNVKQATVMYA